MIKKIHEAAVAAEKDTYVDPATSYTVFTSRSILEFNSKFSSTWKHNDLADIFLV